MKAIARLFGLIGLLPALAIRDDLKDNTLELKDSARPSALVELKDAAAKTALGEIGSQKVRTGKGRHHRHGSAEGHHHNRHKKHHHRGRRHHDDDESTEDDRVAAREAHHSRRKEPESDEDAEVDEDDDEWEDEEEEEDLPRHMAPGHAPKEPKEDLEESPSEKRPAPAPVPAPTETAKTETARTETARTETTPTETPQTEKVRTENASMETAQKVTDPAVVTNSTSATAPSREAMVQSPATGAASPLNLFSTICAWILPCFGWTIVIALVILVALRIKWPELSNIGVHYVAKKVRLSIGRRKEGHETKQPEREEAQANTESSSTAAPCVGA